MADIRVVTPEELQEREKPKGRPGRQRSPERTRIIEGYKQALQDVQPGYGADVYLEEGEDKRQVRQNLKAAAKELNLAFDFRPVKDTARLHFRVLPPEEPQPEPPHEQEVAIEHAEQAAEQPATSPIPAPEPALAVEQLPQGELLPELTPEPEATPQRHGTQPRTTSE